MEQAATITAEQQQHHQHQHDDDDTEMEDYTPRPGRGEEEDQTTSTNQNASYHGAHHQQDESLLDGGEGDLTGSTPRAPPAATRASQRLQFAKLGSPYEDLKRSMGSGGVGVGGGASTDKASGASGGGDNNNDGDDDDESDTEIVPHQHTTRLPDMSMTPRSSLGGGTGAAGAGGNEDDDIFSTSHRNKDPLLHRVLDKNYRIQATPHKPTGVSPIKWKVTGKDKNVPQQGQGQGQGGDKGKGKGKLPDWKDDSLMSSPEMAIPTLRSAAFMSPVKYGGGGRGRRPSGTPGGPRTPGVSVQTPATAKKTKDVFAGKDEESRGRQKDEITWASDGEGGDDDEGLYGGMSPPKTIQFALPPSKLLQTPGTFCFSW